MENAKTIYIAGPMAGLPDLNFPAFTRAEEKLQRDTNALVDDLRATLKTALDALCCAESTKAGRP